MAKGNAKKKLAPAPIGNKPNGLKKVSASMSNGGRGKGKKKGMKGGC